MTTHILGEKIAKIFIICVQPNNILPAQQNCDQIQQAYKSTL